MFYAVIVLCLSFGIALGQTVEEFQRQAEQLIRKHELKEARRLLEIGLRQHPTDPTLLTELGSLLIRWGQLVRGQELLRRALDVQPRSPRAFREAGNAQLGQGHLDSAIALLQKSLQHSQGDAESHHRLAVALFTQGNEEKALRHSGEAVRIDPLNPQYRRFYSLLLDVSGHADESLHQLIVASQVSPHEPQLLSQLSYKHQLRGQVEQAVEYLKLATEQDPESPLYHDQLASLFKQLAQPKKAAAERQKAQEMRSAFQAYLLALRLSTEGKKREAIDILEPLVEKHPVFPTGMMLLADLYKRQGSHNQALRLYMEVLKRDPSHTGAREKGAWIRVRQGSFESALLLLRQSELPNVNHSLIAGYRCMIQGDWETALEHFREVEKKHPLNSGLLQLISCCLSAQGERKQALRYLEKATNIGPPDSRIRRQILEIKFDEALDLLDSRQWKAALEGFRELIKEDGVRLDYLLRMGYCHQQLGQLQQAVEKYRAGLEVDPSADWARVNLASCLYRLGEYRRAATEWEGILSQSGSPQGFLHLGLCYAHLRRFPEAERVFEKAMELGDRSAELLYNLGLVRLYNKKTDAAWSLIRLSASAGYAPAKTLVSKAGL